MKPGFWCFLLLAAFGGVVQTLAVAGGVSEKASVLICGGSMMNGNQFAESVLPTMRRHFSGSKRVALVLHATHPDDRDRMEARLKDAFRHLDGSDAESLHRHDAEGQQRLLETADAIFVGGGETFVLLAELYRTGQLELIRRRVAEGVPYGGSSAGANVAGTLIGTTNDFPVTDVPSRGALGIFPAVINPHHPAAALVAENAGRAGKIKAYLKFNPTETVLALGNAAVARLHRGRLTLEVGEGWIYRVGSVTALQPGEIK